MTYMNIPFTQTQYVQKLTGCSYGEALVTLNLYGWIHWKTTTGSSLIRQGEIIRETGMGKNTVRRLLDRMEELGWLTKDERGGSRGGTRVKLNGITFPKVKAEAELIEDEPTVHDGPLDGPRRTLQTVHDGPLDGPQRTPTKESKKKKEEETTKKTSSSPRPSVSPQDQDRIIQIWNANKPKAWKAMKILGTRTKTVEHLAASVGGLEKFIEFLPLALKQAGSDRWWSEKPMSFANFMGTGKTSKAHFEEFVDQALAATGTGSNSNTKPRTLEHPAFFPPCPLTGSMRPKVGAGFKSPEHRAELEAEAREFYASQRS